MNAARTLALLCAAPALALSTASCGRVYYDAINEATLSSGDLLDRRIAEADRAIGEARTALVVLDDALRDFSAGPATADAPERAAADLARLATRADAAAAEARRHMASVGDVAPDYLAALPADAPETSRFAALASAFNTADASLVRTLDLLDAQLPTLGAAPAPRRADAIRAAIDDSVRTLDAAHAEAAAFTAAGGAD